MKEDKENKEEREVYEHLKGIEDGFGCVEIWEKLEENRNREKEEE